MLLVPCRSAWLLQTVGLSLPGHRHPALMMLETSSGAELGLDHQGREGRNGERGGQESAGEDRGESTGGLCICNSMTKLPSDYVAGKSLLFKLDMKGIII